MESGVFPGTEVAFVLTRVQLVRTLQKMGKFGLFLVDRNPIMW